MYEPHAKELNRFHPNCLRKLLKITWRDKVPNSEVLSRTGGRPAQFLHSRCSIREPKSGGMNARQAPPQKTVLWQTCRGEMLTGWTEEELQGLSQSVTKRVLYKHRNLGDRDTRTARRAKQNQQRHYLLLTKQACGGTTET